MKEQNKKKWMFKRNFQKEIKKKTVKGAQSKRNEFLFLYSEITLISLGSTFSKVRYYLAQGVDETNRACDALIQPNWEIHLWNWIYYQLIELTFLLLPRSWFLTAGPEPICWVSTDLAEFLDPGKKMDKGCGKWMLSTGPPLILAVRVYIGID
jgi:hypothetical protein